ncbi:MAG: class I SAM-dependent methyltransferase [Gammaproteobacteria bacterium]|jgi:SAM-dependent methyltransferase
MSDAFWDEKYAGDDYRYGTQPNRFLVEQARRFPAGGHILCVGDGEGRNGVWLAGQGFRVTSIEPSTKGLAKLRRLARRRGVEVEAIQARLPEHSLPQASYDGAVLTFVHMPPAIRADVHRQVAAALRPGGVLVLEAFSPEQLHYPSGGPGDPDMLYSAQMLEEDFIDLDCDDIEMAKIHLAEGHGHSGQGHVVRLVARRP